MIFGVFLKFSDAEKVLGRCSGDSLNSVLRKSLGQAPGAKANNI